MKAINGFLLMSAVIVFTLIGFGLNAYAEQPNTPYWYPEDLLKWNPEENKDAPFNRGTIPLKDRFEGNKVNQNAMYKPKVVALSAMNPSTSGVPSQGSNKFDVYAFNYWQYTDLLVYWGGSAGEGIIVPPSADVIDAAHKNGVPVLGTIFFPPEYYGGKFEWVEQMLQQRPDGSFPVADKLIEAAEYYGFDGWFINQETAGGDEETAERMQKFLKYLQENKSDGMHMMWYDAMTKSGEINWQNALTDANKMFLKDEEQNISNSMFLNFWWEDMKASRERALGLDRSPYDLFAGINVGAEGYHTDVAWEGLFPAGEQANVSLGMYRPDWTFASSESHKEFYEKANHFWVGPNGDPTNTKTTDDWKGIANYIVAKSSVNELPFTTHFNTGNGKMFAVNGEILTENDWNNRSLQDLLPTWRWIAESNGKALDPSIDWTTAYYGGSSLKVTGELNAENATHLKLYKTDLKVEKHTELSITYKTFSKQPHMKVGISFKENPDGFVFLKTKKANPGKWYTETIPLERFRGKRIASISLYFDSKKNIDNYTINIGQLSIGKAQKGEKPGSLPAVSDPKIIDVDFENGIYADARIKWNPLKDKDVKWYEIYRIKPDGTKEFLGATPNHVYYIQQFRRMAKEDKTEIEIVAVDQQYRHGATARISFEWPPYPEPTADFTVDKTFVIPGEQVTFYNQSSEVTEEIKWEFPGGTPSTSTKDQPVITYEQPGTYRVTLTAKNSEGENVITKEKLITVSNKADETANVALDKQTTSDGSCVISEQPGYAVDGDVDSKWCALGEEPHWLTVDLGKQYLISKFVVKHAEAGGESRAFNTSNFKLQVSQDGQDWTDVKNVYGNTLAVSKHPIRVTTARYARLWITKASQGGDSAARIYEFEVYGIEE
ncbi:endo-beta-N-acetylglucosaminidase [Pseudalkalibacillus decolorationis]|uniref:endo-beta-N-acetylglucosaminidase n=1 Tax=Pseudalkalibacillus decolorationis TaxID=163879 RepID=UPI00214968C7|nr:discoidin domain-containing protein [Pseudalkalibacillus decolorationis]